MTKTALITEAAKRLGDTSSSFLTILGEIFDELLRELGARGAIKQLRNTNSGTLFTVNTLNYSTLTLTGLSSPDYPLDIISIIVPAWQGFGRLTRVDEETFNKWRLAYTNADGTYQQDYPRVWRTYPNDTQVQVMPVPHSTAASATVEVLFLRPPTALSGGDTITQVRQEHFPYLIAGLVKYGAPFQDETRADVRQASAEWEIGMRKMIAEAQRERGRAIQGVYRDA